MDDSDHDFFARAYMDSGALAGVVAFDFRAPVDQGGSRKPKPQRSRAAENYIKARKERSTATPNALTEVYRNLSTTLVPHDENRPFPGSLLHRCVEFYRSGRRNYTRWYDPTELTRHGRGFASFAPSFAPATLG